MRRALSCTPPSAGPKAPQVGFWEISPDQYRQTPLRRGTRAHVGWRIAYVRKHKRETGLIVDEIFVPQSYQLGQEAQVNWYEAIARRARTSAAIALLRTRPCPRAFPGH